MGMILMIYFNDDFDDGIDFDADNDSQEFSLSCHA